MGPGQVGSPTVNASPRNENLTQHQQTNLPRATPAAEVRLRSPRSAVDLAHRAMRGEHRLIEG